MRTRVVIDDQLMSKALELTGLKTKTAVIEEALRTLIRLRSQKQVSRLRGKIKWDGDLDEMRQGRFSNADR